MPVVRSQVTLPRRVRCDSRALSTGGLPEPQEVCQHLDQVSGAHLEERKAAGRGGWAGPGCRHVDFSIWSRMPTWNARR